MMETTISSAGDRAVGEKLPRREGLIHRVWRAPLRDTLLALEALFLLALARLLLALLPFARAMRLLGLKADAVGPRGPTEIRSAATADGDVTLQRIRIALRRASHLAPFRAVCLQQAFAAALMLRRRQRRSEIHFGVAREQDGSMSAHAWTCSSGQVITGMSGMMRHIPVAIFTA